MPLRAIAADAMEEIGVDLPHLSPGGNLNLGENNMARRRFLAQWAGLPFLALGGKAEESKKPRKIMMKSAWGSDDPTRASFAFAYGLALADAGHEVQIFLTGEATYLMRKVTADAIMTVGWPPLSEMREKIMAKHIFLRGLFPGPWGHGN
jgi:hypothetical protein